MSNLTFSLILPISGLDLKMWLVIVPRYCSSLMECFSVKQWLILPSQGTNVDWLYYFFPLFFSPYDFVLTFHASIQHLGYFWYFFFFTVLPPIHWVLYLDPGIFVSVTILFQVFFRSYSKYTIDLTFLFQLFFRSYFPFPGIL